MTNALLDLFQVLAADSIEEATNNKWKTPVPGRVLHIDADIIAYKACDIAEDFTENRDSLEKIITVLKRLAGATSVVLHTTMGDKSNRHQISKVQEYQANRTRTDEEKVDRVHDLKEYMNGIRTSDCRGFPQYDQEADDSLCQAMHSDDKAVLYSTDKDLYMVPGLHLDPVSFELVLFPNHYGRCEITHTGSGAAKIIGKGTSFFWHQMLAGDRADHIPGLPKLSARILLTYCPPKAITNMTSRIHTGRMPSGKQMSPTQTRAAVLKHEQMILEMVPKPVGPMLAFKYLEDMNTDLGAYLRVQQAYKEWYGVTPFGFVDWRGREYPDMTYKDMMHEQAQLLWLHRVPNDNVIEWLESFEKQMIKFKSTTKGVPARA